jgi:hypothetical protein
MSEEIGLNRALIPENEKWHVWGKTSLPDGLTKESKVDIICYDQNEYRDCEAGPNFTAKADGQPVTLYWRRTIYPGTYKIQAYKPPPLPLPYHMVHYEPLSPPDWLEALIKCREEQGG